MGFVDRLKAFVLPSGSGRGSTFWSWADAGMSMSGGSHLPDERDYARLVGDGSNSSLVAATVGWIARQFPEAPPVMTEDGPGGIRTILPRHPAAELLRRPTWDPRMRRAWYSGAVLRMALVTSYWLDGNAYAIKVRDRDLRVVQLWYVPHWMMEPRPSRDGTVFTTHYDYTPLGTTFQLPVSEVYHVRQGIDPKNPLKGYSGLKTVLREIYTDEQAARFTASMLKNRGMPGVILAPSIETKKAVSADDRKAIKVQYLQEFGGDNVGGLMVFGQPTTLTEFGFSPEQLKLGDLRDIPEERVTAITGIPATVVGFGTGAQAGKVGASLREYREQAAENNLLPTWRLFAEEYDGQVLPEFVTDRDLERLQTAFDLRNVGSLQDLELKKAEVAARLVSSGIAWKNEGRAKVGLPPVEGGDVFTPQPGVLGDGTPTTPPAEPPPADDAAAADAQTRAAFVRATEQLGLASKALADADRVRATAALARSQDERDQKLLDGLSQAVAMIGEMRVEHMRVEHEFVRDAKTKLLTAVIDHPVKGTVPANGSGKGR